jgi:CubicO group peptidase (beta-lactamase class C family)
MKDNSAAIPINAANTGNRPEDNGYDSSRLEILDAHLKNLIGKKRIQAASYLISKNSNVIAHKSMGFLCYNDRKEFLPDSIRRLASVTKLFVATSIMQLVENGKLRLDQPLSEIIEEFKNPMLEKINIKHLLTHTSGLTPDPGILGEPYPFDREYNNAKNWIKKILTGLPAGEPDKEWRYSSACFTILAEVVSRVSGVHFEKYVIDNITKPLNMKDSFFDVPDQLSDRVCFSAKWEEKRFSDKRMRPDWAPPRGGGGLFSTLADMQRFGQMLVNKGILDGTRILSRKTVEAMTRCHTPTAKNYCWSNGGGIMEYGLGMNVYSNNTFLSPGSFSHEGAGLCGLYMDPVENVVLAYICPLVDGVDWEPEAVINLRNIVWSGII